MRTQVRGLARGPSAQPWLTDREQTGAAATLAQARHANLTCQGTDWNPPKVGSDEICRHPALIRVPVQFRDLEKRFVNYTSGQSADKRNCEHQENEGAIALETLGSRGVSVNEVGPVCFGTESLISRYAPSDNQK